MSSIGRCATCAHWIEAASPVAGPKPDGWGRCARAGSGMDEPIDADTLAWATDFDHYAGSLNTAPNFGCVMHKLDAETVQEDDGA